MDCLEGGGGGILNLQLSFSSLHSKWKKKMPNRGLNKKQFLGKLEGVPYLRECPADWSDARLFIDDMYKNQRFFSLLLTTSLPV